ncbi:MAG TPA: hypothetical protein VJL86_09875 [Steroidobacteraceae bacterium]|nr:hypothetical protein [Steroidobacteraceae bacterium]
MRVIHPGQRVRGRVPARALLGLLLALSTAAPAARPTAHVSHVRLSDPALAATESARERLAYLVGCALPEGTVVDATVDGRTFAFPGSLGLAPAWSQRALEPVEARRVSACILSRTNRFGVTVQLSLRGAGLLEADAAERAAFALHEGAFFGNVFSPTSPAYACSGDAIPDRGRRLGALRRVCGVADGGLTPGGRPSTHCGFVDVGPCSARPFVQDGVDYSDAVLDVYLRAP